MEKMITQLNEFLSDLEMFNIKLQNYHWNVVGKGFFTTHEKLEEYYNEIREQIDEIAEHILILGYQPVGTMKEFIENSSIQEAGNEKIKTLNIGNKYLTPNKNIKVFVKDHKIYFLDQR